MTKQSLQCIHVLAIPCVLVLLAKTTSGLSAVGFSVMICFGGGMVGPGLTLHLALALSLTPRYRKSIASAFVVAMKMPCANGCIALLAGYIRIAIAIACGRDCVHLCGAEALQEGVVLETELSHLNAAAGKPRVIEKILKWGIELPRRGGFYPP